MNFFSIYLPNDKTLSSTSSKLTLLLNSHDSDILIYFFAETQYGVILNYFEAFSSCLQQTCREYLEFKPEKDNPFVLWQENLKSSYPEAQKQIDLILKECRDQDKKVSFRVLPYFCGLTSIKDSWSNFFTYIRS